MVPFTFFWIVIAWIVFRSDSCQSALLIFKGCFGYGGLSLPSSFKVVLNDNSFLTIVFNNNISFDGIFINIPDLASVGGPLPFIIYLIISMLIVWIMPNTQEFFSYKEYKNYNNSFRFKFFRWRPNLFFGIINAILFCICFGNIEKVSPFLYYQF